MKTKIALKYTKGLVIERSVFSNNGLAISLTAEMMKLGFVPSKDLFNIFLTLSDDDITAVYKDVISELEQMKGADVKYEPMYPNFPKQVMESSYFELFLNALVHYWTRGEWKPDYEKLPRENHLEDVKFQTIGVTTREQFEEIFTKILSSRDSISEFDKSVVRWFIDNESEDLRLVYPKEIPFKENLCFVAGRFLSKGKSIRGMASSATDILRIATAQSAGDISLAANTKFISFPRRDRKILVEELERVIKEEDIARHKGKWTRLFHSLHVGDYSDKVYKIAKKIRNNRKISTFGGRVQQAIDSKNVIGAVTLLKTRPSEFARRIDHLLRISTKDKKFTRDHVVANFLDVAPLVPTRVLLQLSGNLQVRHVPSEKTIVFPKGNVQKATVVRRNVPAIPAIYLNRLRRGIDDTLHLRFSELEPMGKVWIDPELMDCPLPTQQRSVSEGLFQVARGTRLPVGDKNTLRFFIYWVGQDIDLSATLHDDKFNNLGHISYTNLKDARYQACHSGDIVRGSRGACEFIDITMDKAVEFGARYVVMNVLVFSGPTFEEHKKCYAGWMTRERPNSNEIFDAKTVEQKVDLKSKSTNCIPVVFDLVDRKAIWTDLSTPRRAHWWGNNVESNRASIQETLEAIVDNKNKVSLYKLFALHAESHGEITEDREEADVIFSPYDGITPYDITTINSDYLV